MVTNFVGIERDFTVPAGVRADVGIRVKRANGEAAEVGKATWRLGVWKDGAAAVATRFAELLARPAGAGAGDLFWRFPALEAGLWRYEMTATGSDGEVARVFYGVIGVKEASDIVADGEVMGVKGWRMLEVLLPAVAGGKVEAHWLSGDYVLALCTMAQEAAQKAEEMREGIEEAVEEATERSEAAAQRAETAADRAEDAEENVLGKLSAAQAFMESFNKALFEAIRVVDNYLWVGGVNTGHYLRGQDGVTPHIGTDGYWYVGTQRLGDRPAFGKDGITPHITADGFWAFGEMKTTVRAEGRDGLDGAAVRYLIVESVEELPAEGETCNGGFRYCVPVASERMHSRSSVLFGESLNQGNYAGDLVFAARRAWNRDVGRLFELSLMSAEAFNGEPSSELLYAHVYYREAGDWLYAGCSTAAVAQVASQWSTWRFDGLCVPAGCDVRVLLSQAAEQVAAESSVETVRVRVVATADGSLCGGQQVAAQAQWRYLDESVGFYDVYAWLEDGVGNGAWHLMNRTYDFATAQVYGVMKYATDSVVAGGAPVGRNAEGQACVPLADPALPGSVMPATADGDAEAGQTFVRDGRMWVRMANLNLPGVGKTSYTRVVENTNSIGLTEDRKFAVPRAAAFQWGVSKVGSSVPQSNGMPWIIPVAMADTGVRNEYGQDITGQLMNNVLVGGALRTATKETWQSWGPNGINVNLLPEGSNAVGLMTSSSFSQTAEEGLVLMEATTALLGGVRKMTTLGSGQDVPTGSAVIAYIGQQLANYYTKSQVYSKAESERIIDAECAERVPYYAEQTLAQYAKMTDVNSSVSGKADASTVNALASTVNANKAATDARVAAAEAKVAALEGKMGQYVKVGNSGIGELCKLEYDEFAQLQNRDDEVLYLVLG